MAEMTSRERILGAIRGKEIDRVPWSPFLAYYWQYVPREIQAQGEFEYMKKMGADPLMRGFHLLFRIENKNVERTSKQEGNKRYDTIHTPVGDLLEVRTYSPDADTWFLTGHPVSTEEDFKVLQYIYENTIVYPNQQPFEEGKKVLGEDGVGAPCIGIASKTAFQDLVEHWCGTEALTYALYDFPEIVEECLEVMRQRDRETVKYTLDSSAQVLNFYEDSSTTNISPAMFEKYTLPEINEWGDMIHKEDRLLMHHACGHLKDLMPHIAGSNIDILESISPPPTGNISIADASKILPEHIAIIGGIEPTFFETCTLDELEKNVRDLLTVMKGKRFVLANSDSCPPKVTYDKFLLVSELVRKFK